MSREITHESVEKQEREAQNWPQYFVSGLETEDVVPAYYRVEGPNGPVSFLNPGMKEPVPTTMLGFAMEAGSDSFQWVPREETPFTDIETEDQQ